MLNFSSHSRKSRRAVRDCSQSHARGFTLIEVLVTLALVSIGFLGASSIQSFGLQQTHNTYFRTQADLLLRDIAERMQANPQAAWDNAYLLDDDDGEESSGEAEQIDCDGAEAACTANDMAAADLRAWQGKTTDMQVLPAGRGRIEQVGPQGSFLITVSWAEKLSGEQLVDDDSTDCIDGEMGKRSCLALNVFIAN